METEVSKSYRAIIAEIKPILKRRSEQYGFTFLGADDFYHNLRLRDGEYHWWQRFYLPPDVELNFFPRNNIFVECKLSCLPRVEKMLSEFVNEICDIMPIEKIWYS